MGGNLHEYEHREGISRVTAHPEDTRVNVVFVHGLGGSAHGTWTCQTPAI